MRLIRMITAATFAISLSGQTCVTFNGPVVVQAYMPPNLTGLLLQPDKSYTAVTAPAFGPYTIQSLTITPNYQNYIGGCSAAPTTTAIPSVSISPPQYASSAQVVAFGNFVNGAMIPGAAFSATPSPAPYISVGVVKAGKVVQSQLAVPLGAASVASADFNGDGNADLAVVYTGGQTASQPGGVAILLGNGDGTFQPAVTYSAGVNALEAAIADLNGDGKLDIVVTADGNGEAGTGSVTILLGNGDGTFRTASSITTGLGQGPEGVVAADFNGDNKLDLAISNDVDESIDILLGNGDGTFQKPQSIAHTLICCYLVAADFNKDGKLDLAGAGFGNGLVTVLLGKGDGTFGPPTSYPATASPLSLIVTDFNNDGNLDLVVGSGTPGIFTANFGGGGLGVLLGNGDGTFRGGPLYPGSGELSGIAAADLNGDGKPDFVTANGYADTLSIWLNKGNGTFAAAPLYNLSSSTGSSVGPHSVALADLNGDHKVDMVTANSAGSVAVALGNGDGSFQAAVYYPTGTNSVSVAVGDLNGDGKPDLVVANQGSGPGSSDMGSVSILLGSGGGAFHAGTNMMVGVEPTSVVLEDLNGDGKLDLVVLDYGVPQGYSVPANPGGVAVLLGKGDGTFQQAVNYTAGNNPAALAVSDVNGDGKPDLLVATEDTNFNDLAAVFLGNGDGSFKAPTLFPAQQGNLTDIAIADLNGDGKPDIVMPACCGATQMSYLLGNGDGTFHAPVYFSGGPSPAHLSVADFNGDGKPDLAIIDKGGGAGGFIDILLNTTPDSQFITSSATAGQVEPFAPDSIVSAYGTNLAAGTAQTGSTLGTSLDGTSVTITDSAGVSRQALLFYVSPVQINYVIPDGSAPGTATVTITNKNGTSQTAAIQIGAISPGLFQLNSSGLVAAWVLAVVKGVQQPLQAVYQVAAGAVVPLPINVAAANTQVYLEMYGTGIRSAKSVTVTVASVSVPVIYSGPAPGFAGEDQVNIGPLPVSLAGRGNVNIALTADGQAANTVNVSIR